MAPWRFQNVVASKVEKCSRQSSRCHKDLKEGALFASFELHFLHVVHALILLLELDGLEKYFVYTMVQVIYTVLYVTKPLPEPMLISYQLGFLHTF